MLIKNRERFEYLNGEKQRVVAFMVQTVIMCGSEFLEKNSLEEISTQNGHPKKKLIK